MTLTPDERVQSTPAERSRIDRLAPICGTQHHDPVLCAAVEAVPELHELVLDAHGGLVVGVPADAQQAVHLICSMIEICELPGSNMWRKCVFRCLRMLSRLAAAGVCCKLADFGLDGFVGMCVMWKGSWSLHMLCQRVEGCCRQAGQSCVSSGAVPDQAHIRAWLLCGVKPSSLLIMQHASSGKQLCVTQAQSCLSNDDRVGRLYTLRHASMSSVASAAKQVHIHLGPTE